jgi:D-alanyl-lipoteichoic acid acyltransferase DltB (MBOAT superfamily)
MLHRDESAVRSRAILFAGGIVLNILFLGYFKYRKFFVEVANESLATNFTVSRIVIPLVFHS